MKIKQFDQLLTSEIKKAESVANKHYGRKDCKVTGYSVKRSEIRDFYDVRCEICFHYEDRADKDVTISVFMPDRRRSFASIW